MKFYQFFWLLLLLLGSCTTAEEEYPHGDVGFTVNGLPSLATGFKYEFWITVNGQFVSLGNFTITDSIASTDQFTEVDLTDLSQASNAYITIENDTDPAPSNRVVLAGDFSGSTVQLTAAHSLVFGSDFKDAKGDFYLLTPSTATTSDELSGIWFYNPSTETTNLVLPYLSISENWQYQFWLNSNGQWLSLGKFDHIPLEIDDDGNVIGSFPNEVGKLSEVNTSDNSKTYSGAVATLPFPGEDFVSRLPSGLTAPLDLTQGIVYLSLEPNSDDDAAQPFYLLNKGLIIENPQNNEAFSMTFSLPSATASLKR